MKKKSMSVREMRRLLGLGKTESYWLVKKNYFDTVIIGGKMRVMIESFENWYANQLHYKKIIGEAPGKNWTSITMSIQETARLLGIDYGLELMMALFDIVQGIVAKIMATSGLASIEQTVLPDSIIQAIEESGFWESVPLWAVTLIGSLFITVLSFIMIMTVYGRFFKIYLYTAIAPVPLASFSGEPSSSVGKSFIKSYAAVCLEGAIIVLGCIIFSLFAASPPVVDETAAAVNQVWTYVGELIFNMIVLVGTVKMSDRVVKEMMGL